MYGCVHRCAVRLPAKLGAGEITERRRCNGTETLVTVKPMGSVRRVNNLYSQVTIIVQLKHFWFGSRFNRHQNAFLSLRRFFLTVLSYALTIRHVQFLSLSKYSDGPCNFRIFQKRSVTWCHSLWVTEISLPYELVDMVRLQKRPCFDVLVVVERLLCSSYLGANSYLLELYAMWSLLHDFGNVFVNATVLPIICTDMLSWLHHVHVYLPIWFMTHCGSIVSHIIFV